jgi:toxin FitB
VWLLDTNVISELRRPKPEPEVVAFVTAQPLSTLFVSIVTFAEFRFGIEVANDLAKEKELATWLARTVRPLFLGRELPVSEEVMLTWRHMMEEGRRQRRTPSQPDLIIAATAVVHGLTVVSRDTREYLRARVPVLNPWPARQPRS